MTLFHKLQVQVLHYANNFHINEKNHPQINQTCAYLCLPWGIFYVLDCVIFFCSATLHKHALNAGVFLWNRGSSRICAIWFLVHNFYSKNVWTKNPRFSGFKSPSSWKQTFDFFRGKCALSPTYQQKLQPSQVNFRQENSNGEAHHGFCKQWNPWLFKKMPLLEFGTSIWTSIRNLNCSKFNSAKIWVTWSDAFQWKIRTYVQIACHISDQKLYMQAI